MKKFCALKNLLLLVVISVATTIASQAQTITTLTNFDLTDGANPLGTLVQGPGGNFYGTTSSGGNTPPFFHGTVFKVTPDGNVTTLHDFNGSDGDLPQAGLVLATDGNFYGTTWQGGSNNYGTIYKITAAGAFTLLRSFTGGTDGRYPGELIQASDGNFYGTAWGGGDDNCQSDGGCGVIFKITPQGTFSKIYQFVGSSNDGDGPQSLVQARDGNFYGMTIDRSSAGCTDDCGSIFEVTSAGHLTVLHKFRGVDGIFPSGQLLQTSDGNFYGTTFEGGTNSEGTVFRMTPSGSLTTLYNFCSVGMYCSDGAGPATSLLLASDGTFYGTTSGGGTYGCTSCGTVFKITPGGNLTTLYSFNGTSNGGGPDQLIQASNGNFYSTTAGGGTNPYGTFFQFFPTGKTLTVISTGDGTVTSTDGVINCPGTCTHIYPNNTPVTLSATAAQGSIFTGWGSSCPGTGACQVPMSTDQTVYATFAPLYTLTINVTGNGSVSSTDGFIDCPGVCSHVYAANTSVTLNGFPAQGWSLTSWGGSCFGLGSCTLTVARDETVDVTFTQDSYTLTASLSGQGTITSADGFINCPGVCSHTYLSLTPVTLNASPAQGFNFSGWSGACTGIGPCQLTVLGNYGVSAYFLQQGSGLQFSSITPCRLVDTRHSNGGGGALAGGRAQEFNLPQIAQTRGCPDLSSATVYSLNLTLIPPNHAPVSYLTIWPAGLAQPLISTMNSLDGRVKANAAIVPVGLHSSVSVYPTNDTDLVIDIDGYFSAPGTSTLKFYPLAPCRVADTRKDGFPQGLGTPHLSAGVTRDFPVQSAASCNIPPEAQAYSLNVTAIPYPTLGTELGYLELWPTGQQPQNPVSTLNNPTGTIVANAAIVPAGTGGQITAYASNDTDLAIDINGYFASTGTGGLLLYPTAPCRAFDSRGVSNGQPFTGALDPPIDVEHSVCAPPSTAGTYVFNATVVPSPTLSYLTLWPDSQGQPVVSTLNAADGWITSNMAIMPSVNGKIDAYAAGITQLVLDISSYFAP